MRSRLSRMIRLARFLYRQRFEGFTVSEEPLLDDQARDWLVRRMEQARSYLEFGAGGTTVKASHSGLPTISIESDRFFARAVRVKLAPGHQVELLDARIGLTTEWGIPVPGTPSPGRIAKWRRYVELPFASLTEKGQQFPDLVLVDGRFRRACALKTAHEASRAGANCDLLFDDYFSEGRDHYHAVEEVLGQPSRVGRAALFRLDGSNTVETVLIEEALADYR